MTHETLKHIRETYTMEDISVLFLLNGYKNYVQNKYDEAQMKKAKRG